MELHQVLVQSFEVKALHPGTNAGSPFAIFIFQTSLIILVARICGWLFRKIGQPAVIGEIFAGILLGPSLMGDLFPGFSHFVFPPSSLPNLEMFSQFGLILFMFVIGMEVDTEKLRKNAGSALVISHASIVIPFGLGVWLSYFLYARYAPASVHFYAFSLFMGIAMSITAFPVLARIIRERGLMGTRLGTMAITCAAIDDISAWCLLALVITVVKAGSPGSSFFVLFYAFIYGGIMLFAVKLLMRRIHKTLLPKYRAGRTELTIIFVILLLSAYCTDLIAIHALFGAFIAGFIMPRDAEFRKIIVHKIEDIALVLLLPLFFVFTGLRTHIDLLGQGSLRGPFLMIILIAVAGKFGARALAARWTGESLPDSLSLGALMNTRGLVELVVFNIGFDLKILTPAIFTMMVLMALITSFMANPLLDLISKWKKKAVKA